jgi:hypothetical protein
MNNQSLFENLKQGFLYLWSVQFKNDKFTTSAYNKNDSSEVEKKVLL